MCILLLLFLPQPDPGARSSISLLLFYIAKDCLPVCMDWFVTIALFVLTLVLEPIRYIIGFLVILIVYFKSRLGEKHPFK
jgi:rod shape determining protein RodA